MQTPIWVTVITGLLSGLITLFISTYFYVRHDRRKEKLRLLKEIMANRAGLAPSGTEEEKVRFFGALNSTFAIFHDSKPVVEALQDFKRYPDRASDNVTRLIRHMSEDLKIDTSYLQDSFFDEPFAPTR